MFAALSVRNFRLFWYSQFISLSGTWMQSIGQSWLVVTLTDSKLALGLVTMLQFLPVTILSLFTGVIADRVPKRRFLMVTQTAALVQALILGVLVATGLIRLWEIYILAAMLGLTNAFDNPTRQSFVPEMVGRDLVSNAVALNSALFNSARIVGPAIGGITIATLGVAGTFFLNAASFVPVIGALTAMRESELAANPRPAEGRMIGQVKEGLAYSFRQPSLVVIIIVLFFVGTFGYNFSVGLPAIAKYVLHVGAVRFGIMTSVLGLGSLAAALSIAYYRRTSERQLLAGAGVFSVVLIVIGLSHWYGVTVVLLAALGFAGIIFSATANTRMQLTAPDHLRGRVMSLYVLLFLGTTPLGALLLGVAMELMGVQAAIVVFGAISLLGVALGVLYRRGVRARRVAEAAR